MKKKGQLKWKEIKGMDNDEPTNSQRKKARPIPTGAKYVDLCFTTANMIMTKTSCAVKNISIKRPCEIEAPPPNRVEKFAGPGNRQLTTPAAAIPATNWAGKTIRLRRGGIPPVIQRAKVT